MRSYLENIWKKTSKKQVLTFGEYLLFFVLSFFEWFYKGGFWCAQAWRRISGPISCKPLRLISIGNIAVGGTGKTPLCHLVVEVLKQQGSRPAVVMRGHKSGFICSAKKQDSLLVSDGDKIFCDSRWCGDEAYLTAATCSVPVVIGKNRIKACRLLQRACAGKKNLPDCAVLDDAYQQRQIKKDLELLLLDARAPFENNHVLPAGRLRESDITRADALIVTHADRVTDEERSSLRHKLTVQFSKNNPVFFTRHACDGVFINNEGVDKRVQLVDKPVFVFAGIGSFDSFVASVKDQKLIVSEQVNFPDHYGYTQEDLVRMRNVMRSAGLCYAVTTTKDWVKLAPLLKLCNLFTDISFLVMRTKLVFLSHDEHNEFVRLVGRAARP